MVTSASYMPFQSAYRNYLAGLPVGIGRAYQAQTAPLAQLAYWSAPATYGQTGGYTPATGEATNPFATFLQGGLGTFGTDKGYSPMTSAQWQQRAQDVQTALQANPFGDLTGATEEEIKDFSPEEVAQLRIQERFGLGSGDTAQQLANQAALVNAAVSTATPVALRGENAAILQRMFDQWQGAGQTGNYLQNMANVWAGFGI